MAIMFPVIAGEKSFAEYPSFHSEDELTKMASEANEHVRIAYVEIDGKRLSNMNEFIVRSSPFDLYYPKNNIVDVRPGITRAVSEGYWIILRPLAHGIYQLKFGGEAYLNDTLEFKTDVVYHLNVV